MCQYTRHNYLYNMIFVCHEEACGKYLVPISTVVLIGYEIESVVVR